MKAVIISDSSLFVSSVKAILFSFFGRQTECAVSSSFNGRKEVIFNKPQLVILDIDSSMIPDPAEYLVRLVPKYAVPVIVCTRKHNMNFIMVNAGALAVINKSSVQEYDEKFTVRMTQSLMSIRQALENNRIRTLAENTKIIAIGGSTGGTEALPVVLKGLKPDCPPVICVVHMPEGYTKIYASQLDNSLDLDVHEAENGMYISSGQVIIAAGSKHLRLFKDKKGYFITSEPGVKVSGHCPSVDVLFDSVAYSAKSNAIGVILTGMGSDGAKGMLNMRKMGAYNIGQDEKSSVVYGMPKMAFENGAVNKQRPLDKIADEINVRLSMKI